LLICHFDYVWYARTATILMLASVTGSFAAAAKKK
jgi:hypothetical protein